MSAEEDEEEMSRNTRTRANHLSGKVLKFSQYGFLRNFIVFANLNLLSVSIYYQNSTGHCTLDLIICPKLYGARTYLKNPSVSLREADGVKYCHVRGNV